MKFSTRLSVLTSAISAMILGLSMQASAVNVFGSLSADAGTYAPFALGDDVGLSACNSTFDGAFPVSTYNLCDSPTVSEITFTWFIAQVSSGAVTILTGPSLLLASGGAGDFINAAGAYVATLSVSAVSSPLSLTGGDLGFITGPTNDNDTVSFTVATVPEPSSALLLIPALFYVARRQRRVMRAKT